jgi:hypothetical protein
MDEFPDLRIAAIKKLNQIFHSLPIRQCQRQGTLIPRQHLRHAE